MSDQAVLLVAEDLDNDRLLIRRAFQLSNVMNPMFFVYDGEEVVAYLKGEGRYGNRDEFPLPTILLLDLKMPKLDGFEVIRWIRQQKEFATLRIVVLTSSQDMRDVNHAYELGANSFLVKPIDFERFMQVAAAIKGYWLWLDKTPVIDRPRRQLQLGRKSAES